ncbi:hypothetical protein D3C80_1382550 [compost metagenome]
MDGGFVQRAVLTAIAKDSATDRAAQVAWGKHVCRRVVGVVAVAFFLVAQADFQAVLVPLGAQQAHLDPGALDQRVEGHGGAVDAQVTVGDQFGRAAPGGVGDLCQAGANGQGAVLGRGRGLEQLHAAVAIGQDEIGESAAGVYAQAILVTHACSPVSAGRGQGGWLFRPVGHRHRGPRHIPGLRLVARPGRCARPPVLLRPDGAAGRRSHHPLG